MLSVASRLLYRGKKLDVNLTLSRAPKIAGIGTCRWCIFYSPPPKCLNALAELKISYGRVKSLAGRRFDQELICYLHKIAGFCETRDEYGTIIDIVTMFESIGAEIEDHEEEAFLIFCQVRPSTDLGFIDPKAAQLELTVGNRNFLIHQSPTILSSNRFGGTTGAVVWKITPLFAAWLSSASNLLFRHRILNSKSSILELGCGISGLVALALKSVVRQYVLTDQDYVMKLLKRNLDENSEHPPHVRETKNGANKKKLRTRTHTSSIDSGNIVPISLDWETDQVSSKLSGINKNNGFDAVIACDCIYNDTLIQPLVETCVSACELRSLDIHEHEHKPTVCVVAQQLRSAEVFESWLKAFSQRFRVWRLLDEDLTDDLRENSGYVVHLGIIR